MNICGMPEASLVKRILAVLARENGQGTITVPLHKIRKLAANDCLLFSLNEEETQLQISVQSGKVEMTPLLPLEFEREQPIPSRPGPMVVRRSPEEEAELLERKLREQQEEAVRRGPMQASLGAV